MNVNLLVKIKDGVEFHPKTFHHPEMFAIIVAVRVTAPQGYIPTITSGIDGVHKHKDAISKHYRGLAFDFRIYDYHGDVGEWVGKIMSKLGGEYYVRLESDHIHIQYNG